MKFLFAPYFQRFQEELLSHVISSVPLLTEISRYYLEQPSKRLRPYVVLLMCQATNGLGSEWDSKRLGDVPDESGIYLDNFSDILHSQICLAKIIEIIHVASLLHDDVIDHADIRRGAPSAPLLFSPHRAILGGDFLFGKALALTAHLNSPEATILVAQIVCTLVEGEMIQADETYHIEHLIEPPQIGIFDLTPIGDVDLSSLWKAYLLKTYMKAASMFSQALRCCVLLGGSTSQDSLGELATSYGSCLGMAFQLIDDLLDFEGDRHSLGKPAHADLELGLATAPVIFALQEHSAILPLVLRKFSRPGDIDTVVETIHKSQALARTRHLAECYAAKAEDALSSLPESAAKTALIDLTKAVVTRHS